MSEVIVNLKASVAGRYRIDAIKVDADGNEISRREVSPWFDNLITNSGLDMLGTNNVQFMSFCRVGSGSTAPANTDTTLVAQVAATSTTTASVAFGANGSSPYYKYVRTIYRFSAGAAAGNLSEVGVGPASTGNLFSRSLIKDGSGNPTTITILSDEILDVTYEFRLYQDTDDVVNNITVNSVDYTLTTRASSVAVGYGSPVYMQNGDYCARWDNSGVTAYTGTIGAITGTPSGTNLGTSSGSAHQGYTTGNYYRDSQCTFAVGTATGTIAAICTNGYVLQWQTGISPAIVKTSAQQLRITGRVAWSRYAP